MEAATLSEYQDALRKLLRDVMHQQRVKPHGEMCRVALSLPQLANIIAHLPSVQ